MCREPSEPGRPQTFRAFFMWEWKYVCISLLSRGWTSETKLLCISSGGEFILCERDWHKRSDLCFFFSVWAFVCVSVLCTRQWAKRWPLELSWLIGVHITYTHKYTQAVLHFQPIITQLFYLLLFFFILFTLPFKCSGPVTVFFFFQEIYIFIR